MKQIEKTFTIKTSPEVMRRFERFLALLHFNSCFGHSGTFAMPLDGDGGDKVIISPKPKYSREVDLVSGIGGHVEIAYNDSYGVGFLSERKSEYIVKSVPSLIKNGEIIKTII